MIEPLVVATIRKNSLEEVRVSLTSFNGHDLVDVRTYADFTGNGGDLRPTKKGVSLNRSRIRDLIEALEAAERGGA